MTSKTSTTNPRRPQSLQAQTPQHLPPTRTPRTFGYHLLPADAPESAKLEHVLRFAEFIVPLDLPPLVELIDDRLPPGCRFPREPLFRRDGAKRLSRELRRGDHLVLEELRAFHTIPDARETLKALENRGVTVSVVELGIDGRNAEHAEALRTAIAMIGMLRSAARWSWPTKKQTRKRKRRSKRQ